MTHKHYEAISQVIKDEIGRYDERAIQSITYNIIDGLCDYFQEDNPRFDRVRFLEACGITK